MSALIELLERVRRANDGRPERILTWENLARFLLSLREDNYGWAKAGSQAWRLGERTTIIMGVWKSEDELAVDVKAVETFSATPAEAWLWNDHHREDDGEEIRVNELLQRWASDSRRVLLNRKDIDDAANMLLFDPAPLETHLLRYADDHNDQPQVADRARRFAYSGLAAV